MVEIDIEDIAQTIAHELGYEWNIYTQKTEKKDVFISSIEKESYLAVADLKDCIFDRVIEILEKEIKVTVHM